AHAEAHLRPDAGPQVGRLDGLVRELGWPVPPRLPRRQGRGPRRARGRVRPRLPAHPRFAHVRAAQAAGAGRAVPEDRRAARSGGRAGVTALTAAAAASQIQERFGLTATVAGGEVGVSVPRERWVDVVRFAKDTLGCRYFNWLTAVDHKDQGL